MHSSRWPTCRSGISPSWCRRGQRGASAAPRSRSPPAGQAGALVAGGVDALGAPLMRWLAQGGLNCGRPAAEAVALLVLEEPTFARERAAPVLGAVMGHATGFEPEPTESAAGDGLAGA